MSLFRKSAFTAILLLSASGVANAATGADDLLNQIDADIAAKRLGAPAGNNAIEKIWQFKDSSPYDQRINTRAFHVGEFYVGLANKAIAAKKYAEAQDNLDKAWDIASLTPGLSKAQDNLDTATGKPSVATIQARPATPAAAPVKEDNSAELAAAAKKAENDAKVLAAKRADDEARAQALAAKKTADDEKAKALAAKKAEESKSATAKKEDEKAKLLAAKKAAEEEKAKKLAEAKALKEELAAKKAEQAKLQAAARKEQENKRLAAEKSIVVAAASTAGNDDDEESSAASEVKESQPSIASFDLNGSSVETRSTTEIRGQLAPICQEIIDNDASVVLHTPNLQDARWLVVRLTLCVRRIDKDFRLRHSYDIATGMQPSVSLHAGRNVSLGKKTSE